MDVRDAATAVYDAALEPARADDDVPPDYKRTEVGVIPEDWVVDYIESFAHITTGSKNTQDRTEDGQFPFFVRSQIVERINSYSFDGEAVLTAGDGVGTGKVFHYIDGKFDVHQRVYRISDFAQCVNGFFFYLYFSEHFYNRIMQMTAKSSVDSVRREMIARMLVPVPPTSEQQAIAEALSDADALIESLQQLIAKQRALKQGAMQALLTGRQRLPGFSGEWQTKSLEELFTFSGGFSASRDQLGTEGHCYLHYGDIHTSNKTIVDTRADFANIPKLDVALKRVSRGALLNDGDVVFVDASEDEEGASKHVVVVNPDGRWFISGLHTIVAKPRNDDLIHAYRRYCFQAEAVKTQFRFYAVGTKVLGVSKGNIGKIELPVPKRDEQTAIAIVLSDMDADIDALEARLAKTRALKQGMMQQLLTGRIRLPLERVA